MLRKLYNGGSKIPTLANSELRLLKKVKYKNLRSTNSLLTSVDVVVNFEVGDVREDPATDLALIELLLARLDRAVSGVHLDALVYVLAVALLVDNVVPVRLEAFTAHLNSWVGNVWINS